MPTGSGIFQISGAPAWLSEFDSAYDMEGRPGTPVENAQCRLMVQSLFTDRFKLSMHKEQKEASVYLLTIGKNGAKLHWGGGVKLNGSIEVNATGKREWPDGWTMSRLSSYLSDFAGRPVLDQTGLTGEFGIELDFSRNETDNKPTIFSAVQDQLGLKLSSGKAPIEMLVIDHIEKPNVKLTTRPP